MQDPTHFDVILCENLYGDIVSDLCAGLIGGLGVAPGANIGDDRCRVRGGARHRPPISPAKTWRTPLSLLMSAVMMLEHLGDVRQRSTLQRCGDENKGCLRSGAARRKEDARSAVNLSPPRSSRLQSSSACCAVKVTAFARRSRRVMR